MENVGKEMKRDYSKDISSSKEFPTSLSQNAVKKFSFSISKGGSPSSLRSLSSATPVEKTSGGLITNDVCDSSHEGRTLKTSFNLQRWFILFVMFIYSGSVGCHFFNWVPWEHIFLKNIPAAEGCSSLDDLLKNSSCEEFTKTTNRMFLIFQASMYTFSFVSGLVFDVIGPKLCSVIGNLLLILGWFIFMTCSSKFRMYELAIAIIGAGTDAAFFGTMGTSNLFPNHSSVVIAVLRAARSLSNIFPVILKSLGARWPKIFNLVGISICFIILHIFCLLTAYVFIPSKTESHPGLVRDQVGRKSQDERRLSSNSFVSLCDAESTHTLNDSSNTTKGTFLTEINSGPDVEKLNNTLGSFRSEKLKHRTRELGVKRSLNFADLNKSFDIGFFSYFYRRVQDKMSILLRELNILRKYLQSVLYLPVIFIAVSNLVRNDYYVLSAKHRLGSAQATLTIINVFLFVPGPICGYLVNRFGPFYVMNGLNILMGIAFILVILVNFLGSVLLKDILLHLSVLLIFPSLGFSMSQIYCYITLVFDSSDIGKLAGFASFVAGLFCLLTEVMTRAATTSVGFIGMDLIAFIMTMITIALTLLIMINSSLV